MKVKGPVDVLGLKRGFCFTMGRHALPDNIQNRIRELASNGVKQTAIARELKLSRVSVERIMFPERVNQREKKARYSERLIALDRSELPPDHFDVYAIRFDWLTG